MRKYFREWGPDYITCRRLCASSDNPTIHFQSYFILKNKHPEIKRNNSPVFCSRLERTSNYTARSNIMGNMGNIGPPAACNGTVFGSPLHVSSSPGRPWGRLWALAGRRWAPWVEFHRRWPCCQRSRHRPSASHSPLRSVERPAPARSSPAPCDPARSPQTGWPPASPGSSQSAPTSPGKRKDVLVSVMYLLCKYIL